MDLTNVKNINFFDDVFTLFQIGILESLPYDDEID